MSFLDWIGSPEGARALAGTLGGVVISTFNWEGLWLTLRKTLVGACVAYALGPLGVVLLHWALTKIGIREMPNNAGFATAFLLGVFGMVIIETGMRLAAVWRSQDGKGGRDV